MMSGIPYTAFIPPPSMTRLGWLIGLSLVVHAVLLAGTVVLPRLFTANRFYVPPVYTVSLVSEEAPAPRPAAPEVTQAPLPAIRKPAEPRERMTLPAKEKDTVKEAVQKLKEKRMRQDALKQIRDRVAHRKAPQAAASRGVPGPPVRSGVVTRDQLDLKFKVYYGLIWERVQSAWILPEAISRQNRKLETIVAIRIQRNGQIAKTWVEKESGDRAYDQSTLRAVAKANPLPPLPSDFTGEYFEVGLRFTPEGG
jgi:TonB family protein